MTNREYDDIKLFAFILVGLIAIAYGVTLFVDSITVGWPPPVE
jgi:hypothetical protein